jgi:hypothetical protein
MSDLTTTNKSVPTFDFNMSISAGDVVAMGVSDIAGKLNAVIDHHRSLADELEPELKKAEIAVSNEIQLQGKASVADVVDAANVLCKLTSAPSTVEICVNHITVNEADVIVDKITTDVAISVDSHSNYSRGLMRIHTKVIDMPTSVKELNVIYSQLKTRHEELIATISDARGKLRNIGDYEKQLRANLTRQQLSKSDEGVKMNSAIESFVGGIDLGIDSIPKIKA